MKKLKSNKKSKKRKRGMTIDYNTMEEFLEEEQKTKKKDVKKNLASNQQFQIQGK